MPRDNGEYTRTVKPGLIGTLVVGTIAVWVLALIGLGNVVGAITAGPAPPAQQPLLAQRTSDVAGIELGGLRRYPGAVRTEYRTERFGDVLVSEVEYQADAGVELIRAHYRAEFERAGWTATVRRGYGEWAYTVMSGRRQLVVEIEGRGGVTEIEVEMTVQGANRGQTTDR
jgi:hypothetical protein